MYNNTINYGYTTSLQRLVRLGVYDHVFPVTVSGNHVRPTCPFTIWSFHFCPPSLHHVELSSLPTITSLCPSFLSEMVATWAAHRSNPTELLFTSMWHHRDGDRRWWRLAENGHRRRRLEMVVGEGDRWRNEHRSRRRWPVMHAGYGGRIRGPVTGEGGRRRWTVTWHTPEMVVEKVTRRRRSWYLM